MVNISSILKSQWLAVAVIASIATPAVTTGLLVRSTDTSQQSEIYKNALQDRERQRKETRKFWDAVRIFGDDVNVDINPGEADPLLNGSTKIHGSGSAQADNDLSAEERLLIRTYAQQGYCPPSLKRSAVEDLYERCLELAEEYGTTVNTGYVQTDDDTRRAVEQRAMPTLKLRFEMLRQAMDRSTRRDETGPSPSLDRVYWWEKDIME